LCSVPSTTFLRLQQVATFKAKILQVTTKYIATHIKANNRKNMMVGWTASTSGTLHSHAVG
jgi:hypothetical protein